MDSSRTISLSIQKLRRSRTAPILRLCLTNASKHPISGNVSTRIKGMDWEFTSAKIYYSKEDSKTTARNLGWKSVTKGFTVGILVLISAMVMESLNGTTVNPIVVNGRII